MPLFSASDVFRLQRRGKTGKLLKALQHNQGEIRESAAKALGELGREEAVIPLIIAMDDWNIDVRVASIEALGRIGDRRAVDALVRAMREKSLRQKSLQALIQIGKPSMAALADILPDASQDIKLLIIDAMARIGGKSVIKPLVECLRERDREIQDAAAVALTRVGKAAVPELRELLNDRRKAVRGAAVKLLGIIRDPSTIQNLIPLLKDENYQIRQLTVKALDEVGWRPETTEEGSSYWIIKKDWSGKTDQESVLINGLAEDLPEIRIAAVRELGKLKSDRSIDALKMALEDRDRDVQLAAISSLGLTGDLKAVDPLIEMVETGDAEISTHAANAIQGFGNSITNQIIRLTLNFNPFVRKLSAQILGSIGDPEAVTPLIRLLKDESGDVVSKSIEALGKIGDPVALEHILPFLKTNDIMVQISAAQALGEIGDHLAVEPLLMLLRSDHESVRLAAVNALGKISDPVAVEELINALNDNGLQVRQAAADAIGNMGAFAVKPLIAILGDWDKDVQAIRKALTTIGSSAIRPLINALSSNDSKVSEAAAKVLSNLGWQPSNDENGAAYYIAKKQWLNTVKIGQPALKPLITATRDTDVWVRTGAVESLGNIGDRTAVDPLISMFNDKFWNVRDAAVEALVKIGESAVEQLIEVLEGRNPDTVEYAARTLGAIGDEQAIEPLNDLLFADQKKIRRAAAAALEKMGALSTGRRCSLCGKPVPKNYRTGDSCAFCDELLDI